MEKEKLEEFLKKRRAQHEKELAELAQEQGLNSKADTHELELMLLVKKETDQCRRCSGVNCWKPHHRYQIPVTTQTSFIPEYIPCKVGQELRRLAWFQESNIPLKYRQAQWEQYRVTAQNELAVQLARAYVEQTFTESLYLSGTTGSGKTFLASLIGLSMLEMARKVYFANMPTVLSDVRASYSGGYKPALSRLKRAEYLILDDVGASRMTDWAVGILYEIVNSRYNSGKPMVLTSNFTLDELGRILTKEDEWSGQRIISRLSEMAICANLGKQDWRLGGSLK